MSRQRILIAAGVVLVALSIAFAASTAVFNATYREQARIDAELTNGADVTVTGQPAADLASRATAIERLSGVTAVEPMQHRFAYVGSDLQDLYGIQPRSLSRAATVSDAFFAGMSAKQALSALATNQNGVLVSAETVRDFQLQKGDLIRLRLQNAQDHQYHVVEFRYIGVVREFPTAPTDSFLVANAAYVAQQTGSPAAETLLIRTNKKPASVATEVRKVLGPTSGATVRDLDETRLTTNSSLTAVSLRGITRVELVLSVGLAVVGSGLVLALGLEERRRTLAIVSALGARRRQLGAFVWSEAVVMLAAGWLAGVGLGWQIARMLVKLLTGVFDPPPEHLAVPWVYLAIVTIATVIAVVGAAQIMTRLASRSVLTFLRAPPGAV